MSPAVKRPAEETLKLFWTAISRQAAGDGWIVGREMDGHSNRGFMLANPPAESHFFVKVSQVEPAFWGLAYDKARELADSESEHLVLLTGPYEGYVVDPKQFKRLLKTFSKSQAQYIIHESKVRTTKRFTTVMRCWQYLRPSE